MKRLAELLAEEHTVIEQMLACLDRMVEIDEGQGCFDLGDARDAVDFFVNFVHRHHRSIEDRHLYPAMERHELTEAEDGALLAIRVEHEMLGTEMRGMQASLAVMEEGDQHSSESFCKHSAAYARILRRHMQRENGVLFQMARELLSEEDELSLSLQMDAIAESDTWRTPDRYRELARRMGEKYGAQRPEAAGC